MCGPALLAAALLLVGCAGRADRPPATEVTRIPQNGDWFCQPAPSGDGWECVQDAELAADPEPARLPAEPARLPDAGGSAAPSPAPLPAPEPELAPEDPAPRQNVPPSPQLSAPPQVSAPEAAAAATPETSPATPAAAADPPAEAADQRPAYARLAYQPPEPVPLLELPGEFYAVQVLATSTREELEAFVDRHGIQDASAARVERNGELYYVLLLGIYRSRELARQAVAELPPPLADIEPWIRPLRSLKSAMRRADALAGSSAS